jgi:hypothetical protein
VSVSAASAASVPPAARTASALVTEKAVFASSDRNEGRASLRVITTVPVSAASIEAIGSVRNEGWPVTLRRRWYENTTSSASSAEPSVKVTPSRRVKV